MCHLSESCWTTNSNKRQADSCDKSSECHKAERDSTALGRGSDVPTALVWSAGIVDLWVKYARTATQRPV